MGDRIVRAKFSQSRNDMYWSFYSTEEGETIRWSGYADDYWWNNVAPTEVWRRRVGKSGTVYTLDPGTNDVTITAFAEGAL